MNRMSATADIKEMSCSLLIPGAVLHMFEREKSCRKGISEPVRLINWCFPTEIPATYFSLARAGYHYKDAFHRWRATQRLPIQDPMWPSTLRHSFHAKVSALWGEGVGRDDQRGIYDPLCWKQTLGMVCPCGLWKARAPLARPGDEHPMCFPPESLSNPSWFSLT